VLVDLLLLVEILLLVDLLVLIDLLVPVDLLVLVDLPVFVDEPELIFELDLEGVGVTLGFGGCQGQPVLVVVLGGEAGVVELEYMGT
jgi:hypothetical protein